MRGYRDVIQTASHSTYGKRERRQLENGKKFCASVTFFPIRRDLTDTCLVSLRTDPPLGTLPAASYTHRVDRSHRILVPPFPPSVTRIVHEYSTYFSA